MKKFPVLEIDCSVIRKNAARLLDICRSYDIEPFAVIKGFNCDPFVTKAIVDAGYRTIASSRLHHLAAVKASGYAVSTLALRIPMLSEVNEIIKYADISLNSQLRTLVALDKAATNVGKIHKVILMMDVGDLREGIFDKSELLDIAVYVENKLHSLYLYGIGTNFMCYGSVVPTEENLSMLAAEAGEIEQRIGRRLEVVSGGATATIPLMVKRKLPQKINNLRIGTALILPMVLADNWNIPLEGMSNYGLILSAEIIEIGEKPTYPVGIIGVNGFGHKCTYVDRGIRERAVLALGDFDVGDCNRLKPIDPCIKILGASSDHMIVDIQECMHHYSLGECISFTLLYQSMLFATGNPLIAKIYHNHANMNT